MNTKRIYAGIIVAIGIIFTLLTRVLNEKPSSAPTHHQTATSTKPPTSTTPATAATGDVAILSELQSKKIIYTKHARCRMECRYISEQEVLEMMSKGQINHAKSKPNDYPCPTYALEGITQKDGQKVRIVLAKCADVTKVVTVIDTGKEYTCHCE